MTFAGEFNWNAIRSLDGAQHKGFEELCTQLARSEAPNGSQFVRKGTPDAGVECYCVLPTGQEWGWQAKYVFKFENTQVAQVKESIDAALKKHPNLTKYYVCVPIDLADPRISKGGASAKIQDSSKSRWNKLEAGFKKSHPHVGLVWWGSAELIDILSNEVHFGRRFFFFNDKHFGSDWFRSRIDIATKSVGPRYTPKVHVNVPIANHFESFGRTKGLEESISLLRRDLDETIRSFQASGKHKNAPTVITSPGQAALDALKQVKLEPANETPLSDVLAKLNASAEQADLVAKSEASNELGIPLYRLSRRLRNYAESVERLSKYAHSRLLILTGTAGSGKTHLLCDIAKKRVEEGLPTILLLGQQFMSDDPPWTQALAHLDLRDRSTKEIVGALECASQRAQRRVLVIVDALNEGNGGALWPSHLAAFLAELQSSPWIAVVLSVRSPLEEAVVPEDVLKSAVRVKHVGFSDVEFDAMKSFFEHYKIELPTTPILAREFQKPLFLKLLCTGLTGAKQSRLPRGILGVSKIFQFFLDEVNKTLARELDYDPDENLVNAAIGKLCSILPSVESPAIPRADAKKTINALLPGRSFSRSLYPKLVENGVLFDFGSPDGGFTTVAYEKLFDHLLAKSLLDDHLNSEDPASSFAPGTPLASLFDQRHQVSYGLLEALAVQIPERTKLELSLLAPKAKDHGNADVAFVESLVWRDSKAFSEDTLKLVINDLRQQKHWQYDLPEALLTLASVPDHPLNAKFLDSVLRKQTMAERDAWWSVFLHRSWAVSGSAVHRLFLWVEKRDVGAKPEKSDLKLVALTLAWMLSCSHRFVRDRATKELVRLLTGHIDVAQWLVEQFHSVDDPYITERVYCAAYGVSLRSDNRQEIGQLAKSVYDKVFANEFPPVHVLLRDYARGIVERALHLRASIEVDASSIRPPYKSQWPTIPEQSEVDTVYKVPDGSSETWKALSKIQSSLTYGDFDRYVLGRNSRWASGGWLSRRLDEDEWREPTQEELAAVKSQEPEADEAPCAVDEEIEDLKSLLQKLSGSEVPKWTLPSDPEELRQLAAESIRAERIQTKQQALRQPPRFDTGALRRYILSRVIELGWTVERFGHFDWFDVRKDTGLEQDFGAERMGKKYQWIAYHEVLAYLSDHHQYREAWRDENGSKKFEGPWQHYLRDIDPSVLFVKTGGTGSDGFEQAWWCDEVFASWDGVDSEPEKWVKRTKELPDPRRFLSITQAPDGPTWLSLNGEFRWSRPLPAGTSRDKVALADVVMKCRAYLFRNGNAKALLSWAEKVDFGNTGIFMDGNAFQLFLGEHGWRACVTADNDSLVDLRWEKSPNDGPVEIAPLSFSYLREEGGTHQYSLNGSIQFALPAHWLLQHFSLKWRGTGADFVEADGTPAVRLPHLQSPGADSLLLRADLLSDYLASNKVGLCWFVYAEKQVLIAEPERHLSPLQRLSGAYVLTSSGINGSLKSW
jgi:hypothetical protein